MYIGPLRWRISLPHVAAGKIKKQPGTTAWCWSWCAPRDILAEVASHRLRPRLVVGFAAETDDVERNARDKLVRKRVDLIAGNRVGVPGSGFDADDNTLHLYWPGGERTLGPAPKHDLAAALLDVIVERLG